MERLLLPEIVGYDKRYKTKQFTGTYKSDSF